MANGDVGVGYGISTNASSTTCSAYASSVSERIAFSLSGDGGQTFGGINYLGNETCSYLDATEPSFALSSDGTIYGAYVEYNNSGNPGDFTDRSTNTALGFTVSTDNGVTFSDPITINSNNNIAKPQVAAFGKTVYVVFENISNGTASITYGLYGYYFANPISESLLYSTDSGATWSGPIN
ncbi:MAG TPA: sialidase family protein, partial [Thermoplasmata archaeon]